MFWKKNIEANLKIIKLLLKIKHIQDATSSLYESFQFFFFINVLIYNISSYKPG